MSPAMIFVVPAVFSIVLALVSALAYRHTGRRYLLWWTGVWAISIVYYLAVMSSVLAGQGQSDLFAQLGLLTTATGWLRGAALWVGARVLVGRPMDRRFWLMVAGTSAVLAWVVIGTPFGQQSPATTTRLTYAAWFFLAAVELLRQQPRTTVGTFCGVTLLLLGIQGSIASQLTLDLAGSMMSGWISTALALALGLGVLGRTLEDERELARRRSGELTAANARLAELDQLKTDFVSMISHELRTPLGLIKGYAGTLLRPDIQLDEATHREFLQVIEEETDSLTELVANLLDMSRIESGTLRVDPAPTDLGALVTECAARLRVREPERTLHLEAAPDLPLVLADERRIIQVVDNLLTNATRYTPADSPILLRARANDQTVAVPTAVVEVVDRGPGIPPSMHEQVFEKFVRLESGERPSSGGTGLGLAICRGIVQAHGGTIWVESDGSHGCTVALSLPICQPPVDDERIDGAPRDGERL